MPFVGGSNLFVTTHTTVGGHKYQTIGAASQQPKHVIEVRNHSTLTYTVSVDGEVTSTPPKLTFGGNKTWTSPQTQLRPSAQASLSHDLTHVGPAGSETLCCESVSHHHQHGSAPVKHANLCGQITTQVTVT
jgi:hypothetical protein